MSLSEFDKHPRMREYMKPEDLDTDGCVALCAEVLKSAAEDYVRTRQALNARPNNKDIKGHMKVCENFYRSSYVRALSCGLVDPDTVMADLDRQARGE